MLDSLSNPFPSQNFETLSAPRTALAGNGRHRWSVTMVTATAAPSAPATALTAAPQQAPPGGSLPWPCGPRRCLRHQDRRLLPRRRRAVRRRRRTSPGRPHHVGRHRRSPRRPRRQLRPTHLTAAPPPGARLRLLPWPLGPRRCLRHQDRDRAVAGPSVAAAGHLPDGRTSMAATGRAAAPRRGRVQATTRPPS